MTDPKSEAAIAASQRIERQKFKTVDGHCYVLDGKLVITRDRKMKLDQALKSSRSYYTRLGVILISAAFALFFASIEFQNDQFYVAAIYASLGILFGLLGKSELSKSAVTVIDFENVISVKFYGSRIGRRNSIFEVIYTKDLRVIYEEIYLPKPRNSGRPNTQKALELMDDLLDY